MSDMFANLRLLADCNISYCFLESIPLAFVAIGCTAKFKSSAYNLWEGSAFEFLLENTKIMHKSFFLCLKEWLCAFDFAQVEFPKILTSIICATDIDFQRTHTFPSDFFEFFLDERLDMYKMLHKYPQSINRLNDFLNTFIAIYDKLPDESNKLLLRQFTCWFGQTFVSFVSKNISKSKPSLEFLIHILETCVTCDELEECFVFWASFQEEFCVESDSAETASLMRKIYAQILALLFSEKGRRWLSETRHNYPALTNNNPLTDLSRACFFVLQADSLRYSIERFEEGGVDTGKILLFFMEAVAEELDEETVALIADPLITAATRFSTNALTLCNWTTATASVILTHENIEARIVAKFAATIVDLWAHIPQFDKTLFCTMARSLLQLLQLQEEKAIFSDSFFDLLSRYVLFPANAPCIEFGMKIGSTLGVIVALRYAKLTAANSQDPLFACFHLIFQSAIVNLSTKPALLHAFIEAFCDWHAEKQIAVEDSALNCMLSLFGYIFETCQRILHAEAPSTENALEVCEGLFSITQAFCEAFLHNQAFVLPDAFFGNVCHVINSRKNEYSASLFGLCAVFLRLLQARDSDLPDRVAICIAVFQNFLTEDRRDAQLDSAILAAFLEFSCLMRRYSPDGGVKLAELAFMQQALDECREDAAYKTLGRRLKTFFDDGNEFANCASSLLQRIFQLLQNSGNLSALQCEVLTLLLFEFNCKFTGAFRAVCVNWHVDSPTFAAFLDVVRSTKSLPHFKKALARVTTNISS